MKLKIKRNNNEVVDLSVLVGKDELSNNVSINIPKLSHLLIGGLAGSGKSNLLHRIITTLSSRLSPEDLKFILIDSKKIELNVYNHLPHLLTPVITDPKKTVLALKWVGKEMDRRLGILQLENLRDIREYRNKDVEEDTMPYILIVLDGLSDIMATYPTEVESAIIRLTQMSHVVGIHLILSTSRVGNKIITEPIKSGIQSCVSFKVFSRSDSMSILGTEGAERLNTNGEILFRAGNMKYPICAQLSHISDKEIKENVKIIKDEYKAEVLNEISSEGKQDYVFEANFDDTYSEADELYEQAKEIVIESGKASTSWLQRKLGIGYSRSAHLIDLLEDKGVVGPANGDRVREVYISNKKS